MGLPLALFAFGAPGVAGMVALFTTSNLLHFTLGAFIVNKHADLKVLLKSPMVWATIIGASLGLSGLHLPDSVHAPMKMIGDCTIPVMLLSLGVRMLDVKREDFTNSLLGAAVCPLTGLLVAGLVAAWLPMSKTQIGLVYLFGSLPPAVLNFLVADYYKQEPEKVASIVLVGNIASIVFIPFGLWFALR
jgi:malate permease and related proteins